MLLPSPVAEKNEPHSMKLPTRILPFLIAPLLASCATSSSIQRYSESKSAFSKGPVLMSHPYPASAVYRVYQRASTGFTSIATLREDLEARATTFCERQGKGMIVLGERISQPPYILGNFPRMEIVFAAIEKPKR